MTTKPRAKKFRVRRRAFGDSLVDKVSLGQEQAAATPDVLEHAVPGQGDQPAEGWTEVTPQTKTSNMPATSTSETPIEGPNNVQAEVTTPANTAPVAPKPPASQGRSGQITSASQMSDNDAIDAIRREGLTGRQLRMARRLAGKYNLPATSDFEAVRMLRDKGVDPFQRSNMLDLVIPTQGDETGIPSPFEAHSDNAQLPQTITTGPDQLPSTETVSPSERRAKEIAKIQNDLARRRRKKSLQLLVRLAIFVLLPTLLAGYYYYAVATPMYSTESSLVIQKGDGGTATPSLLGNSSPLATQTDSIVVQEFLQSKDAMLRLDEDEGFRAQFSQLWIDPIQRLPANATNEQVYKLYKRHVLIGYDPTEGIIKMQVLAPDPLKAQLFSEALIRYAEEQVDNLSLRKRVETVSEAQNGLEQAQLNRRATQESLLRLQQEGNIADPSEKLAALRQQISSREIELQEKELQVEALLENSRPNETKVTTAQADAKRLGRLLDRMNAQMIQESSGENSLAEKSLQIEMAKVDLATRDMMLQEALLRLSSARRDADSQARFLEQGVRPIASEDPAYPRKFENTILAFFIFAGIYMMISLTASVLREQMSS